MFRWPTFGLQYFSLFAEKVDSLQTYLVTYRARLAEDFGFDQQKISKKKEKETYIAKLLF